MELSNYFFLHLYVWFKYDLGQKYHTPQVQPGQGLNSWPLDHESIFHVTGTPAITTRPPVTIYTDLLGGVFLSNK